MGFFRQSRRNTQATNGDLKESLQPSTSNSTVESLQSCLLRDPSLEARVQAAGELGRMRDPRAVPALLDSIRNASLAPFMVHRSTVIMTRRAEDQAAGRGEYMRLVNAVRGALSLMGEAALEHLLPALGDARPRIRGVAILALTAIGSPKAVPRLVAVLADEREDSILRILAGYAVDKFHGSKGWNEGPCLLAYLQHRPRLDTVMASMLLGEVEGGNLSKIEALEQGMTTQGLTDALNRML